MSIADAWVLIGTAFFVAGLVKGVSGLGLPSVAIGIMTLGIGLKSAIALLLLPSFITNVWQALAGGALWRIIRRTWPMLSVSFATTWVGVALLSQASVSVLGMVLGSTLAGYALMGFFRPVLPHPGRFETVIALPFGAAHGVLAGLTGSFVPGVPFLQAIGLQKEELVQAMGVLFTSSTIALGIAMSHYNLLSQELAVASALAVAPAAAGMYAGQLVRHRLSEAMFKQVLFSALLGLGLYIFWRGASG